MDAYCNMLETTGNSIVNSYHLCDSKHPWYAVQVKSRLEVPISQMLRSKDYESYVPTHQTRRTWSDRIKTVETSLFAGYVFVRLDIVKRLPILVTPGVLGIVGIGKQPVAIPDEELDAVRRIVESRLCAGPYPYLAVGQKVRVAKGPLYGLEGSLVSVKNEHRLVVSVSLLQRCIAAEVEADWVEPIHRTANPATGSTARLSGVTNFSVSRKNQ
jgi:transcription antitermination factor NusG